MIKMTPKKRIFCLLLSVCLMLTAVPFYCVNALDSTITTDEHDEISKDYFTQTVAQRFDANGNPLDIYDVEAIVYGNRNLSAYAEYPDVHVTIMMDKTLSMGNSIGSTTKLNVARNTIQSLLNSFPSSSNTDNLKFSLYTFAGTGSLNNGVQTICERQSLSAAALAWQNATITRKWYTCTDLALEKMKDIVNGSSENEHQIMILLTDGLPGSPLDPEYGWSGVDDIDNEVAARALSYANDIKASGRAELYVFAMIDDLGTLTDSNIFDLQAQANNTSLSSVSKNSKKFRKATMFLNTLSSNYSVANTNSVYLSKANMFTNVGTPNLGVTSVNNSYYRPISDNLVEDVNDLISAAIIRYQENEISKLCITSKYEALLNEYFEVMPNTLEMNVYDMDFISSHGGSKVFENPIQILSMNTVYEGNTISCTGYDFQSNLVDTTNNTGKALVIRYSFRAKDKFLGGLNVPVFQGGYCGVYNLDENNVYCDQPFLVANQANVPVSIPRLRVVSPAENKVVYFSQTVDENYLVADASYEYYGRWTGNPYSLETLDGGYKNQLYYTLVEDAYYDDLFEDTVNQKNTDFLDEASSVAGELKNSGAFVDDYFSYPSSNRDTFYYVYDNYDLGLNNAVVVEDTYVLEDHMYDYCDQLNGLSNISSGIYVPSSGTNRQFEYESSNNVTNNPYLFEQNFILNDDHSVSSSSPRTELINWFNSEATVLSANYYYIVTDSPVNFSVSPENQDYSVVAIYDSNNPLSLLKDGVTHGTLQENTEPSTSGVPTTINGTNYYFYRTVSSYLRSSDAISANIDYLVASARDLAYCTRQDFIDNCIDDILNYAVALYENTDVYYLLNYIENNPEFLLYLCEEDTLVTGLCERSVTDNDYANASNLTEYGIRYLLENPGLSVLWDDDDFQSSTLTNFFKNKHIYSTSLDYDTTDLYYEEMDELADEQIISDADYFYSVVLPGFTSFQEYMDDVWTTYNPNSRTENSWFYTSVVPEWANGQEPWVSEFVNINKINVTGVTIDGHGVTYNPVTYEYTFDNSIMPVRNGYEYIASRAYCTITVPFIYGGSITYKGTNTGRLAETDTDDVLVDYPVTSFADVFGEDDNTYGDVVNDFDSNVSNVVDDGNLYVDENIGGYVNYWLNDNTVEEREKNMTYFRLRGPSGFNYYDNIATPGYFNKVITSAVCGSSVNVGYVSTVEPLYDTVYNFPSSSTGAVTVVSGTITVGDVEGAVPFVIGTTVYRSGLYDSSAMAKLSSDPNPITIEDTSIPIVRGFTNDIAAIHWSINYATVTITKAGCLEEDENQSFMFTIVNEDEGGSGAITNSSVIIHGNGSQNVVLFDGLYTIYEENTYMTSDYSCDGLSYQVEVLDGTASIYNNNESEDVSGTEMIFTNEKAVSGLKGNSWTDNVYSSSADNGPDENLAFHDRINQISSEGLDELYEVGGD